MLGYEEHSCYPENVTLRAQEGNCFSSASKKSSDYANAFLWNYPFGLKMPGCSANTANPNDTYKFTGYENDDEGGLDLYHANARGYDPVLGRFMQVDSLASQFPAWNPYHYVYNNPMKFIDPTGLKPTGQGPEKSKLKIVRKPKKVGIGVKGSEWNAVWANLIDRDGGSASSQSQTIDQEPSDDPEVSENKDRNGPVNDVTEKFDEQLKYTMKHFQQLNKIIEESDASFDLKNIVRLLILAEKTKTNAEFDIKQYGKGFSHLEIGTWSKYKGEIFRFDDYGNYNFGVALRAIGLSLKVGHLGAGLNQLWPGEGHPDFSNFKGWFDDPRDTQMIQRGYNHDF